MPGRDGGEVGSVLPASDNPSLCQIPALLNPSPGEPSVAAGALRSCAFYQRSRFPKPLRPIGPETKRRPAAYRGIPGTNLGH